MLSRNTSPGLRPDAGDFLLFGLASYLINSWPKTRRESTPCCVTNPRQVFNLAVVRALPDADFARFPTMPVFDKLAN